MRKNLFIIYKALERTILHDGVEHAGYMSFMVLLSIFPFLVFFVAFTGFLGASQLGEQFISFVVNNLPENAIESIQPRIVQIASTPPQSILTLSILGTIWTASSFVEGLRTILNRIHEISTPPTYIWRRFLSILQFLAITIIIAIVMLALVIAPIGLNKLQAYQEIKLKMSPIWTYVRYLSVFGSLFLSVATLYYIIPNVKVRFREVVPGALMTVILWFICGYIFARYLSYYHQLSFVYGSLGSVIITLLFFFIVNMIFIYGAEFNHLLSLKSKK